MSMHQSSGMALATEPRESIATAILRGLQSTPRTLPSSLFYDARGASLFERISDLPEYYLTRADTAIMERHAVAMVRHIGPRAVIIEPGSGAATKVRPLLAALAEPLAYVPVDVSREQLSAIASARAAEFPGLDVLPVCADYTEGIPLPPLPADARRVVFFPGSTIGNLHPDEAIAFLRQMRELAGEDGGMLLGVDRRKEEAALHAAYNDAAGVTADFNLNILTHLNREFGGSFDLTGFRHRALFNAAESRIEMHLVSARRQSAEVLRETIHFAAEEFIRTEVSYKYDEALLAAVSSEGGWRVVDRYTDDRERFWEIWLEPA
jgi:dimethylhistidine N-methyltransferase